MNTSITPLDLQDFEKDLEDPSLRVARRAIHENGIVASCINDTKIAENPNVFSVEVDAGEITNQRHSGRCWMFAGLNVIRTILFEKFGVKNIELSQAYLQFYDKLEKANFFLEKNLERLDKPLDDREVCFLLDSAIEDGGHWTMFVNLVHKYGVIPSSLMEDGAVSQDTTDLNRYLHFILASDLKILRQNKDLGMEKLREMKEKMLGEIHRILIASIGVPPKSFVFEYTDKDNHFKRLPACTPQEFFSTYIQEDLDDYVCLCHAPVQDYKPYVKYGCNLVNNVVEGAEVSFFNVKLEEFKAALIAALKDKKPVWFAAEVCQESLRKKGYLVKDIFCPDDLFQTHPQLSKGEKLDYRTACVSHAMTFVGVNLDENKKPNRYKVENTWGTENGKKGFYIMDAAWFDEYVYEIYVPSKYVDPELVEKYRKAETIEVPPFNTFWAQLD